MCFQTVSHMELTSVCPAPTVQPVAAIQAADNLLRDKRSELAAFEKEFAEAKRAYVAAMERSHAYAHGIMWNMHALCRYQEEESMIEELLQVRHMHDVCTTKVLWGICQLHA